MIDIGCDDIFDKNVNVVRMSISEYLYKEDGKWGLTHKIVLCIFVILWSACSKW